jgi:hypothetical protein
LHRVGLAHRHDHDAADLELRQQRAGRVLGRGRHEDAVEGRLIGQAETAIAGQHGDVAEAHLREQDLGRAHQRPVAVDGVDPARELAEHGGLVARAGADLEHLVARLHVERLGHQPHDRGLADRLPAGDRQRHVLVGAVGEMAFHEGAAVDLFHGLKHARVRHALLAQLEQELHLARGGVVVGGHSSAALNRRAGHARSGPRASA